MKVLILGYTEVEMKDKVESLDTLARNVYKDDLRLSGVSVGGCLLHPFEYLNKTLGTNYSNYDYIWPVIHVLVSKLRDNNIDVDYFPYVDNSNELQLVEYLNSSECLVVITTTIYVSPQPIFKLVKIIRSSKSNQKIVVGGPFINENSKGVNSELIAGLLDTLNVDFIIDSNEGEGSLTDLVNALKNKTDLGNVPNLYYRNVLGSKYTFQKKENNAIEDLPIDFETFMNGKNDFYSLRTAKSCPYSCSFCNFPLRSGKYTYSNVEFIKTELKKVCSDGKRKYVSFIDDTFNIPLSRFKSILQMIVDEGINVSWNSYLRSDQIDDEAIDLMKRSGCIGVFLGVESGSDFQLERMNKRSKREDYISVIGKLKEKEIITYASFIVGFPGETLDTVRETISFIEEAKPDFYRAQVWYCDTKTPIYDQKDLYSISGEGFDWSHKTMDCYEASDIVNFLFCNVSNSIWVPQEGFDLWSIYFLMGNGWKLEKIKSFLNCFNMCVSDEINSGKVSSKKLLDKVVLDFEVYVPFQAILSGGVKEIRGVEDNSRLLTELISSSFSPADSIEYLKSRQLVGLIVCDYKDSIRVCIVKGGEVFEIGAKYFYLNYKTGLIDLHYDFVFTFNCNDEDLEIFSAISYNSYINMTNDRLAIDSDFYFQNDLKSYIEHDVCNAF